MVDLRTDFLGIKSPNPFWLASAPPTDRKTNVERAFRAGWGGVVWKTLGEAGPPVVNAFATCIGALTALLFAFTIVTLWNQNTRALANVADEAVTSLGYRFDVRGILSQGFAQDKDVIGKIALLDK